MKRYSHLAMLRKVLNTSRLRMAQFLGVSESFYEKAEANTRQLPLEALMKLQELSLAFNAAIKAGGVPQGMITGVRTAMPHFQRNLESRLRTIRHDIASFSNTLRFITENWQYGVQQRYFLQNLKATIPVSDPSQPMLNSCIATLEGALVQYSPQRQQGLTAMIDALKEQERGISEILNSK